MLVQIHFISASCENLIDGQGMLPGDVLTASNGKTVEVGVQFSVLLLVFALCTLSACSAATCAGHRWPVAFDKCEREWLLCIIWLDVLAAWLEAWSQ